MLIWAHFQLKTLHCIVGNIFPPFLQKDRFSVLIAESKYVLKIAILLILVEL